MIAYVAYRLLVCVNLLHQHVGGDRFHEVSVDPLLALRRHHRHQIVDQNVDHFLRKLVIAVDALEDIHQSARHCAGEEILEHTRIGLVAKHHIILVNVAL
ncbi:hypothetical protein D3C72_2102440 [compost metagenome]